MINEKSQGMLKNCYYQLVNIAIDFLKEKDIFTVL